MTLRIVLDLKDVSPEQVLDAEPFRLTGKGGFDVAAEPVAMGRPEELDRALDVAIAVRDGKVGGTVEADAAILRAAAEILGRRYGKLATEHDRQMLERAAQVTENGAQPLT